MIGAFNYNDIPSQSFDLVARSVKRPLLPPAKPKRIEVAGLSGLYDFDDLEYGSRQITMRVMYIGVDYLELRKRARKIAAWLSYPNWGRLIMDDEPDLYYLAKITNEIDLSHFWESGAIDCVFDCQPFAYSIGEQSTGPGNFNNPGTRKINFRSPHGSKLLLTANAQTNSSFKINERALTYTGSAATISIDSIKMEAVSGEKNVFDKLEGDIDSFFEIRPGINSLSVTGATNVILQYIPLWY